MRLIHKQEEFFDAPRENKKQRIAGWFIYLVAFLARPVLKLLFRYKVVGKEKLPREGEEPVILAANHVSYFDPAILWVASYPRVLRFLARATLFVPVVGGIFARAGGIPITPESADRIAVKRAVACLKRGECLGIFPEGTRMNRPDKEYNPHAGLILIAQMAKCKIMPVGISGTEKIKPYGQKLPRLPKITITYGDPIDLKDYADLPKSERTQTVLNDVMEKIFELRDAGAK
jgi:1-acyl-sn-glycerol-3-phosphate acyltransferase